MAIAEARRSREAPEDDEHDALVVETVRVHASRALAIARRHSLDLEDAQDAFQRALVQLVRHKRRILPETAHSWLFAVVRNEALQVREARQRSVPMEDEALERIDGGETVASVEERVVARDAVWRATEALGALKPDEARALTLQAAGLSYREIAEETSWSATKVNRALTEGRASFRARMAQLETDEVCEAWLPRLSQISDLTSRERAQLKSHLRNCPACRATLRRLHEGQVALRIVLPVALAGADEEAGVGTLSRLGAGLGRFADVLFGGLHDRAAALAFKAQAATEIVSTGKLAVVAASAVAVAGGGVAVHDAGDRAPREHPAHRHRSAAHRTTSASTPTPRPAVVASPAAAAASASAGSGHAATPTAGARSTAASEFASKRSQQRHDSATSEFDSRAPTRTTSTSSSAATSEFGSGAPAATTATARGSSGSSSGSSGSSTSEFGG